MATPPTFVADYETSVGWATATASAAARTTGSFNGSLGDVLVAFNALASHRTSATFTTTSSPVETWTKGTMSTGTLDADVMLQPSTTILTAARTGMTVTSTFTYTGTTLVSGNDVAQFTGSDGIGATATQSGNGTAAVSMSITTTFANSAVVYLFADWAATDASTRTHRTVNGFTPTAGNGQEFTYFRDTINWAVVAAYIPDAGAAGAKTVGLTTPSTGDWLGTAVEVRGTGAAALPPIIVMPPRRP
jgi:hypothetical protein